MGGEGDVRKCRLCPGHLAERVRRWRRREEGGGPGWWKRECAFCWDCEMKTWFLFVVGECYGKFEKAGDLGHLYITGKRIIFWEWKSSY
jgi:hypothetical protein